jgi:protein-disulfide isomerase
MAKKLAAAALAVVLIAGGAWWALQGGNSAGTTTSPLLGAAEAQTAAEPAVTPVASEIDPALLTDRTLGNPDAPIKITEYASFTCPHCANFHETAFKDLKKNYIDTGKAFFTYREVYFDRFGLWAGMIARCGGGDRYFGFVDAYYGTRDTWLNSEDPAVIAENLKRIGRTAGMSNEQIDTCLNNQPFAEALVANFQTNMAADNIEGTPTFIIDGQKYSNMSYEDLAKILDEKLK